MSSITTASSRGSSCTGSTTSSIDPTGAGAVAAAAGHHRHNGVNCTGGCNGAYPRNPQYSHKRSKSGRVTELQNRLPPIKEFRSPTKVPMPSPTHNPKIRFVCLDFAIFYSPILNYFSECRFASYTHNSKTNENSPLLGGDDGTPLVLIGSAVTSPNSQSSTLLINTTSLSSSSSLASSSILKASKLNGISSKIAPMHNMKAPIINMAAATSPTNGLKKSSLDVSCAVTAAKGNARLLSSSSSNSSSRSTKTVSPSVGNKHHPVTSSPLLANGSGSLTSGVSPAQLSAHHRGLILLSKSSVDERADNRKNENAEKKKRDEKIKLKAEKDARKVF